MSNIGDYQALVAAMTVTFTSQYARSISIKSTDAKKLENRVSANATPIRLLLPFGGGENISAELLEPDDTMGPNVWIRWTFSDILLWRPATYGEGLGDSAYDLREYITAYMTAPYAMEPTGITDRMTVENITVRVDELINFPAGSKHVFIGAIATWTVTEDDPP